MSNNVYAETGFSDAEEMYAKAGLTLALAQLIDSKSFSIRSAARRMGIDKVELRDLLNGQFQDATEQQLRAFITCMEQAPRRLVRWPTAHKGPRPV